MRTLLFLLITSVCLAADRPVVPCVAIDADLMRPQMRLSHKGTEPLRIWAHSNKFWQQGKTLRVRFMDGTKTQQDKAWRRFGDVDALVNLTFLRSLDYSAEIRVSFRQSGHWSYLGTDCATISRSKPTMNLQLPSWSSADEYQRVATHEMLHAIGFSHEMQHPQTVIDWNVPVVLDYYRRTQGWSERQTRQQVLTREEARDFWGSAWDAKSIMAYPTPRAHLMSDTFVVPWNVKMSLNDKATIPLAYP